MNTRSLRPSNASDFALKSPASGHVGELSPAGEKRALHKDSVQGIGNSPLQSSAAHETQTQGEPESSRETSAPQLSSAAQAPVNSIREDDEMESEELETEEAHADELAIEARTHSQSGDVADGHDEDYAEFERIFVEWKATGDPRLRERLILMHRSMVMFLARRFMDRGELFEDVLQVGMLGLIYALDGYDMDRGVKFSTFAIPTISGEIRRYFRDKVSGMRVPRGLQELHSMLQTRIEELTQQLDRSPTYAEIAFSLKIEVEQVVEAMELGAVIDPLSIDDRFYGEESATIAESIGAPDPQLHAYEEHAALQAALEKLGNQERRVLEMSYFEGHSQAEIARRLNVSQMHISRLLRRSLAQLKELIEDS